MIAELGHFALILVLVLGCVQAVAFCPLGLVLAHPVAVSLRGGAVPVPSATMARPSNASPAEGSLGHPGLSGLRLWPLPLLICILACIAQGSLIYSFIVSDFTLPVVARYSHSSTPLLYQISASMTSDGGATLLWISLTALATLIFAIQSGLTRRAAPPHATVAILGLVVALLATSVLIDGDPFARTLHPPLDGQGFDPQAQDLLALFYRPFLFGGLAALSVIFAATISALPRASLDRPWAELMRPWTLGGWTLLGVAMAISAYRAYAQQPWGNWWYWDVSENAVLMAWLLATALVHGLAVLEKTEALKPWTALLALSAFGAGWFGVFLARSDLLGPLPSALSANGNNVALLVGFCVLFGGGYYLFSRLAIHLRRSVDFSLVSRESGMFINSVMLAVAAAIVLIGTIYPLLLRWFDGTVITVGPPFFVQALLPIALPVLVMMGIAPTLRWRFDEAVAVGGRMKLALILSLIVTLFVWMRHINAPSLPLLGIGLAAWVMAAALGDLWERLWHQRDHAESKYRNFQLLGPRYLSMTFAHIGVALLVAGGAASNLWEDQTVLSARTGQSIEIGPYNLQYEGVALLPGENYATRKATFIIYRNAQPLGQIYPEVRYYPIRGQETHETGIWHGRDGDLHVSIGDRAEDGGRIVNVRFLPMMTWVWAGMLLILLGGVVSLITRALLLFKVKGR
jgi:cytochrome c-type biogenesis protein CcmF